MGLGKLNPGCSCNECPDVLCFGSISGDICGLNWQTSGNVTEVRLIFNGGVISTDESGVIYRPALGTYSLQVRCGSDLWQEVDVLTVTSLGVPCRDCCNGRGYSQSSTAIATVNTTGNSVWVKFDNNYVINTQGADNCVKTGVFSFGTPTAFMDATCGINGGSTLFTDGYFLTQRQIGLNLYDSWAWPSVISINQIAGTGTIGTQAIRLQMDVTVYNLRLTGSGPCFFTETVRAFVWTSLGLPAILPCGGGGDVPFNVEGGSQLSPPPPIYSYFPLNGIYAACVPG